MNRVPNRGRRGTSLIEMVMIIAGVTTLMAMTGGFLHTLFRLEGAGRSALTDAGNVARLARQFRADVRAAEAATPVNPTPDAPSGVDLSGGGLPSVSYRQSDGMVVRTEQEGDKVLRREAYRFGRLGPATFRLDAGTVRLDLPRAAEGSSTTGRAGYLIEARLGKYRARAGAEGGAR